MQANVKLARTHTNSTAYSERYADVNSIATYAKVTPMSGLNTTATSPFNILVVFNKRRGTCTTTVLLYSPTVGWLLPATVLTL